MQRNGPWGWRVQELLSWEEPSSRVLSMQELSVQEPSSREEPEEELSSWEELEEDEELSSLW